MKHKNFKPGVDRLHDRIAPSVTPAPIHHENVRAEIEQVLVSHTAPEHEVSVPTTDHGTETHDDNKEKHDDEEHSHGDHAAHKEHGAHTDHGSHAHAPHEVHLPHDHVHADHPKHEAHADHGSHATHPHEVFETLDEARVRSIDALFRGKTVLDFHHNFVLHSLDPHQAHIGTEHLDAAHAELHDGHGEGGHEAETHLAEGHTHGATGETHDQQVHAHDEHPHVEQHLDMTNQSSLLDIAKASAVVNGIVYAADGQAKEDRRRRRAA